MASVNKVIVLGNLGKDPEVRYTQSGDAVCNFSVATSERWKDKSGEQQERTEWHRIVMFGRIAEVAGEYLKKGSQVYLEGKLQTRKWVNKEGLDQYTTEVIADRMQLIGAKREDDGGGEKRDQRAPAKSPGGESKRKPGADFDDDIPF